MVRIVDVERLNDCTVLFLDGPTPKTAWKKLKINGEVFSPIPVYDIKGVVAVSESGFLAGQIVEFV